MNVRRLTSGLATMMSRLGGAAAPTQPVPSEDAGGAIIRPERFNPPASEAKAEAPKPKKKKRRNTLARTSALLLIGVPSVLGALYFLIFASNQYSANFQLAVRSNDRPGMIDQVSPMVAGLSSSPVASDSHIVVEYLRSRQLVEDISKTVNLRAIYARQDADIIARLSGTASIEELVDYWRKRIDVKFENQSGIITASVRAFRPEDALAISTQALKLIESLVNELSRKAREESVAAAEDDVKRMEIRMASALAMMKKFRDRTGIINAQKGAEAGAAIMGKAQEELVRLRTQLAILAKNMNPTSPPIVNLKQRIAALEDQIAQTRDDVSRNAGESRTPELTSQLLSEYETLELEKQFSEKSYAAALSSLERARSEASRTQRYLTVFVQPHLPEEETHPKRALMTMTVLLFSFLGWGVFLLVYLTIKEHIS
jgi:capsular polysaccharide transport system permease protein